jgi:hypothetical protein
MKMISQPDVMAVFELDDPARHGDVNVSRPDIEVIWLFAAVGSRKIC